MIRFLLYLRYTALVLIIASPALGSESTQPATSQQIDLSTLQFERIAVMPFLAGRLEAPDNPVEKPLSLPLNQLPSGVANLAEGAELIMTQLVHHYLQVRYNDQLVTEETATAVHADVLRDPALGTPRKLAVKFGENLGADLVVVGAVWRFREKGAGAQTPESPASVAFAVYLVEVSSGKRLWRNAFDGTQKILSEDLLGGLKQVKIGMRWISVTELARLGVASVFKKFPLR